MMRVLTLVAIALSFSVSLFAQGTGTKDDPYIMVDGGEYAFNVYKDFYGRFVVPEDVTEDNVTLELVANNILEVFSDEAMTESISIVEGYFSPYTTIAHIKKGTAKGTTLYVYSNFPMNEGVVSVSYGSATPMKLNQVLPEEGSILSAAKSYVSFEFSKNVRFDKCVMIVGSKEHDIVANLNGRFVSIEAKADMMKCYDSGELKEGDEIFFVLKNVVSADGKTNLGDLPIRYVAAPAPTQLTATTSTPDNGLPAILSWMPKSSELGLVTLTFNNELNTSANVRATLTYGNAETEDPGEYYIEEIAVTFPEKNILAIDLRDKLRLPATMVTSGTNYGSMMLTIRGVEDINGHATLTDGIGTSGAYFFNYGYEVVNYNWTAEFTPASGTSIDNVETVELWLLETGGRIEFSGAKFEYTHEGKTKSCIVGKEEISISADPDDEAAALINIPVPTFSRDANTTVTLSFVDLKAPNGLDYSSELTATYTTAGFEAPAGIADCVVAGKPVMVYDLMGRLVAKGNVNEVTKALKRHTIYVVNGKKVVISE